jgi:uncharacterized damage-inducible protein DinB
MKVLVVSEWKRAVPDGGLPRICHSLRMLSDQEIWWRPNDASNSMGNLVLHLCGNMRQWIIAGLGGAEDIRKRDLEFSEKGPISRDELIEKLQATVREASKVVAGLSAMELGENRTIQGFRVTVAEAVLHVATHVAYHAGQIIYFTKMKRGTDLGFTKLPPLPAKKKAARA